MQTYILMHKNSACAVVVIEEQTGRMIGYKTTDPEKAPFLGNCDLAKFSKWWETRAVPASREWIRKVMRDAGVLNPAEYLAKNLAVSITDTYWLCPDNSDLTYEDVSFVNLIRHGDNKVPYHNATSYDPNASLGGNLDKYWDLSGDVPVLVKESYKYYGQQALNEAFATRLHEMQETDIPFVKYTASRQEDGGCTCRCNAFTSEKEELVPAYEMIESRHIPNNINYYNAYIEIAAAHGADRRAIQDYMDYQTLTDFIITNTDEHLLNFGMLRDTETMKLTGPAPIFDSGNSMFYSDRRNVPYTRAELLSLPVTGFYKTEEKMLANVKNCHIVKTDLLPDPEMVKEYYSEAGIPEQKAEFISQNYATKIEMVNELQSGKKISLYQEKQRKKETT